MRDPEALVGEVIADYQLIRLLGSGGNGVVYQARHKVINKITACKILHAELAENPVYVRNFVREARMAARLEHPHIIQALDVGSCDGLYYFIMEYVEGISLEKMRTSSPEKITLPFLLETAIALAEALDFAWQKFHVIHGDIKPDNLMIRSHDGALKLADLGLAKVAGTDDPAGEIMATPLYAAPEVAMGNLASVGVKSDIYSFGIMLYELLSGAAPFQGSVELVLQMHVDVVPPPLIKAAPFVEPALAAFVDKMIAKAPADRPADWGEIKVILSGILKKITDGDVKRRTWKNDPGGLVPVILLFLVIALGITAVVLFCRWIFTV
ncbi:MAG: serine/threonine protein kinase [Lentisphaeria bacterium]|nr:serine/threonine protein kinase [Lentisphaeria bacterium]